MRIRDGKRPALLSVLLLSSGNIRLAAQVVDTARAKISAVTWRAGAAQAASVRATRVCSPVAVAAASLSHTAATI